MDAPANITLPIPSADNFDATTQILTFFTNTGNTIEPVSISLADLTTAWYQNMHFGLVYGAQLGLASLMLITLLLLTQPGKRRAPIYILNVSALVLDLTRSALMAYWLTGVWNHPVVLFLGEYDRVGRGDYVASIMVNVVRTMEVIVILWSLILQVRVILCTVTSFQRAAILSVAFIMATVTVSVQLAVTVVNSRNILLLAPVEELGLQERLADLSRILQMVSICFFLLIFVVKLGVAIRQRKRMGCANFGPMQIVFIGSLQSMLLPVIFTATQWRQLSGDFGSLSSTILAIQLPLTALWASTSLEAGTRSSGQQLVPEKARHLAMGAGFAGKQGNGAVPISADAESYRLKRIPMTTTIGSLDVDVKMDERDMV